MWVILYYMYMEFLIAINKSNPHKVSKVSLTYGNECERVAHPHRKQITEVKVDGIFSHPIVSTTVYSQIKIFPATYITLRS